MKVVFVVISSLIILAAAFWFFKYDVPWFTPLERRRLPSAVPAEIVDESVMLSSTGREAPVLTGFTEKTKALARPPMETVRLKTQDGVEIVGDYYSQVGKPQVVKGASRGVLLLHMMPSDRKSWRVFAEKLQRAGLPVLAIDLRGHGESQGGPDGYRTFSDVEHQDSRLDVMAGALFLRSKQIDEFDLVGASIGANLALQYMAEHPNARSAVLLSPGLDYRGLRTTEFIGSVPASRGIFLVASDDDEYSKDSVNELASRITLNENRKLKIFESGGHGTNIFENHPEFMDELVEWLTKFN